VTGYIVRRNGVQVATPPPVIGYGLVRRNDLQLYRGGSRCGRQHLTQFDQRSVTTASVATTTLYAHRPDGAARVRRSNLSWTPSTKLVTGYIVRRMASRSQNSCHDEFCRHGLSAATTYSYTVAARDAAATSHQFDQRERHDATPHLPIAPLWLGFRNSPKSQRVPRL